MNFSVILRGKMFKKTDLRCLTLEWKNLKKYQKGFRVKTQRRKVAKFLFPLRLCALAFLL